ncbi:hypothetical protein K456DRAFT_733919 [Colletotrichum gloeosporioides 23]|nr:hypothetical protein K456DRAFT_733919 [Colletotrichum gloeosporioides 23]
MSCVISDMNTAIAENKERSKNGDTSDDDGSANNDSSSSDEDLHGESCSQESAVPGPKLMGQDSSGTTASHILPRRNSAVPDFSGSPSCAASPYPSYSIDVPAPTLDSMAEPQTDAFAIPTPSSEVGDATISWRKRGHRAVEDGCESHDRRLPKRRRSRDVSSGTASPALPARTLRALPSRALVDQPGKSGLTTQCDRQLRRSPRRKSRPHTAGAMSCSNNHLSPAGPPTLNVDNASRGGKRTGRRRGRSPTTPEVTSPRPGHSSGKPGPQRSGQAPVPPAVTTADPSLAICHTCGFSAEYLLRLSDTVQALTGRVSKSPDSERGLDMLQLFLGFISDYATKRLLPNATRTRNNNPSDAMNREQVLETTVELNSETFKNDESFDESSDHDSGKDSDSGRESASSDRSDSPDVPEEMGKRPPRRRWTPLDELRLRAWVQEGKEWFWIAGKLQRSEQAIVQHWAIMGKQVKKTTKK